MNFIFIIICIFLMPMILGIIFGLFGRSLPVIVIGLVLILFFGVHTTILLFIAFVIFGHLSKFLEDKQAD